MSSTAPTIDSHEEAKEQLYNRLLNIIAQYLKKDNNILMGDINSKIGHDKTGYKKWWEKMYSRHHYS